MVPEVILFLKLVKSCYLCHPLVVWPQVVCSTCKMGKKNRSASYGSWEDFKFWSHCDAIPKCLTLNGCLISASIFPSALLSPLIFSGNSFPLLLNIGKKHRDLKGAGRSFSGDEYDSCDGEVVRKAMKASKCGYLYLPRTRHPIPLWSSILALVNHRNWKFLEERIISTLSGS